MCGSLWVFLFFWSLMAVWLCLAQGTAITLVVSDLEVTVTDDGALPVSLWRWAPWHVLVDLIPESGVGTNQGIQISTSLYHRSWLCCSLTVETKRSYKWSLNAFGRTPGYSALLGTLLLRKKLNKKKWCFTESCPLLLLMWWICQREFLCLER